MVRQPGKEEWAKRWQQFLELVSDQMLRACLPTSADKVRQEGRVLTIEIESEYKRGYVQRKAEKLLDPLREVFGDVDLRLVGPAPSPKPELPLRPVERPMERPGVPRRTPPIPAQILVVGIGTGGINALRRMRQHELVGVRFVAMDTDSQVLAHCGLEQTVLLGSRVTRGRSAGGDPEKGKRAADEVAWEIEQVIDDAQLVFLTCGLGGGTGTGAAPVVGQIARAHKALTVGVVTLPFSFEGVVRKERAQAGLQRLAEKTDVLIVIRNDRLLEMAPNVSLSKAFALADEVLLKGVQAIADLITVPGLVNLDFADVAAILRGAGTAMMGTGEGMGENRALRAAKAAVANPLLEGGTIKGARRVLLNITGGEDLTLSEVIQAADFVRKATGVETDLTFGAVIRPDYGHRVYITTIAADFQVVVSEEEEKRERPRPVRPRRPIDENTDIPAFLRRRQEE